MIDQRRVTFESAGETLVGILHHPSQGTVRGAIVLTGPLTSVKEQATGNYARALAERGFVALAFDHRFFGESGGKPRQYESPAKKIEDVRAAVTYLSALDAGPIAAVGVCAGGGYMAGAVAADDRILAWGAVAGFFHDARKQREWMGDEAYDNALAQAGAARERWEKSGEAETIPAVGKGGGPVAMPLDEAYEYYGTPRGAVENYVNAFAVLSREDTLPYDAQSAAACIVVPTLMIHSDKALAPALARRFFDALAGPKAQEWFDSKGQIDFYDDPRLIEPSADRLAAHFTQTLAG